uniref:Putative ribonuclease H-like domain-containing protein n=1 Tax=Tanacetum cinerariifolium TaxID=118510 RepID=A0A6L2P4S3_TANCI|nr:putative ribonuclease H-like domain-containing protein [Tanacetum cinerariifolium]
MYFLENKPNVAGKGPTWLFDLDYLTDSMNYQAVRSVNQANKAAGPKEANHSSGTQDNIDTGYSEKEAKPTQEYYVLPLWYFYTLTIKSSEVKNGGEKPKKDTGLKFNEKPVDKEEQAFLEELERLKRQEKEANNEVEALRKESAQVADFKNLETTVNKAIRTKWVYRNKKDEKGVVVRNKARLVAQGHRQEEGIDYDKVFALVARIEAIRIFLGFSSYMGFIVYQMNVKSAFLYGTIDEEVYVTQPLSFVDPEYPKKVYKVVKALYGLHQAPRSWYATLSTFLLKNGYKRGTIDKTLFIKKDKKDIMLEQVYVNDIIFGSTKKSWCDEFKALMKSRFQMSSMGELTFFIGLQVKQKEDGIFISQDKYVAKILKNFDFMSVKTASTPIETQKPLTKDEEAADVDVHFYRSMIGSLMYLTASRLDIMFAVCACSRFQVTPKTSHLQAVKRIFRHLKGKPKQVLWYPRVSLFDLEAYSDSDYVGANLDRNSITRGLVCAAQRCFTMVMLLRLGKKMQFGLVLGALNVPKQSMMRIHATVDSKAVVVTEASIRSSFLFNDVDGTACLTNEAIFQNLALMGYEEGESSRAPTEPQPTPSPTHPSTGDQPPVQSPHDSPFSGGHTSDRAEETVKDARAAEIIALKARIKKLKKKCKPSISHHRAWLKNDSTFDGLDADLDADHDIDYMDTEEPVNDGRLSEKTKELKLTTDTEEITQDKGSGEKERSTEELVSTAWPKDSTVRPDVGTADLIDPPPTTTSIFDDEDIIMAQTLIKMKEEKAKEKGVSIKDIEDSSRPARSILTLKPLLTIDPKGKGKCVLEEPEPAKRMTKIDLDAAQIAKDAEVARLPSSNRKKEKSIHLKKEQSSWLKQLLLKEDSELHKDLLRYEAKTFAEIQGLYERQKRVIDDFKPMDSDDAVDKENVLEEPDSTKVEVKQEDDKESIMKRPGRRLKMKATKKSKRQKTDSNLKEEEHIKTFLQIVPDEEGEVDYEVLDKRFPIINWELKFYHLDIHGAECIYYKIFRSDGSSRWIKTFSEMVTRKKVPTYKKTLERMLALRLIVKYESEVVFDLLRFIQKQIDESGSHDGSEKDLTTVLINDQTQLCTRPMGEPKYGIKILETTLSQTIKESIDYLNYLAKSHAQLENSNSFKPVPRTTANANGTSTSTIPCPVTTEEKAHKKNDVKARSMLLMALSNEHLFTFSQYKDAKTLFESIQERFSGFDWSYMAHDEVPTNMALMAFSDSEDSKSVCVDTSNKIKKAPDAPIIEDWVSDSDEDEYEEMVLKSNNVQHKPEQANQPRKKEFCSTAVLTMSGIVPISTARQSSSRASAPVSAARPINIVASKPINVVKSSACWVWRTKIKVQDHVFKNSGSYICKQFDYVDPEGRLKNMTGNISYLTDFNEYDGGYVAFGGGAKGGNITGKGTIRTGKLDFKDVYFVKELQFNLFNVLHTRDKKNSVLFTDTECFVLSPNFKLADENQVLLKVPRKKQYRNKTLIEAARTMLADSKLPTTFWAEAVSTACYVQNRVLVVKPYFKTPYELFKGRSYALSFMRPFGCHVSILNTLDQLGKFDGKSDEGIFVGYSTTSKAFRVYNIRTRKVEENLHITFLENKPIIAGGRPEWLYDIDALSKSINYAPVSVDNSLFDSSSPTLDGHNKDKHGPFQASESNNQERPNAKSSTKTVNTIGPVNTATPTYADYPNDPLMPDLEDAGIFNDAYDDKDKGAEADYNNLETDLDDKSWVEAIQEELFQFKLLNVWALVDLPHGKRAIRTKWVYRNKRDQRGIVIRNKARLVARGYRQEEGIDYDKVFAPVARIEAISQPLRFVDLEFLDRVYKVEKALYGLRQASRACVKSTSTPIETHKPLSKDAARIDVDVYLYSEENLMIKGQPTLGIWYPKDSLLELIAYSDSDYVGASLDRKSTTGGYQFLGSRLISWQCKKQTIVANSTTKAEYIVASNYCGQVLWLQNQLLDYGYNFMQTKIHVDNESAICMVKNLVYHSKTKHIEIRHHFIRDSYEKRLIEIVKIHTDYNVADLLTKAFYVTRF